MSTSIDTIQPCQTMPLDIETTAIKKDIDSLDLSKTAQINLDVSDILTCNINHVYLINKPKTNGCTLLR
ncbi:MAG: hypothetical protein EAZ77_11465 [Nostocales cyanobacterium]|nr:MAG: hypothetical protein EAZ77_11465 [Nostocales cyanobacterium]